MNAPPPVLRPLLLLLPLLAGCHFFAPLVHLPAPPAPRALPVPATVVVCPLVDARPELLRQAHLPQREGAWIGGIVLPEAGLMGGQENVFGARLEGDEEVRLAPAGEGGHAGVEGLDEHAALVVARLTGQHVGRGCAPFDLDDVDQAAQGASGPTLVAIPVLDQLDETRLESRSTAAAWFRHETYVGLGLSVRTTTRKQVDHVSRTPAWVNVRLRVVLLRTEGSTVLARRTVYAAGWQELPVPRAQPDAAPPRTLRAALEQALQETFDQLALGLAQALEEPSPPFARRPEGACREEDGCDNPSLAFSPGRH